MSLWGRLRGLLSPAPVRAPTPPPIAIPPEEAYLRQLLEKGERAGEGWHGEQFWAAVDGLVAGGRATTAAELLRRFLALDPEDRRLLASLAGMLHAARDESAVPLLERLAAIPEEEAGARFRLGEAHERAGRLERAREEYEAVLALDIDHPNARARADRLRPRVAAPVPGRTIAGLDGADAAEVGARYRLSRELGRGSSATVYLARDVELDCDVALKLLHADLARRGAAARVRLFAEARVAAALRHPGVVAIYDLDEERGLIAMELCRGGALRELLARRQPAPREAIALVAALLDTLDAVHRAGVVHLDVKPGNLLFRREGAAPDDLVLGDFGLAHLGREGGGGGTPAYMAPEQRRGEISSAADVFAAGVVLLELVEAGSVGEAGLPGEARRFSGLSRSAAERLGTLSPAVAELLAALLDHDAGRRPRAGEAALRLRASLAPGA